MTEVITATYLLTTPLFCGGADPTKSELRLPSFKGVLRWYWRALAWQRLGGVLAEIRREEQCLFGSPDTGRGRVSMRLVGAANAQRTEKDQVLKNSTGSTVGPGARYLGYGVMEAFASNKKGTSAGQLTRGCLMPPLDVTIELRARGLTDAQRGSLLDALTALGLLGGLGGKSRKGYGSLMLARLAVDEQPREVPSSIGALEQAIKGLHSGAEIVRGLPAYTALNSQGRHVLVPATGGVDALGLLDRIGREIVRYRSWGHDGKILDGIDSEHNFEKDHDLMKRTEGRHKPRAHPTRIVFGLPHNYGKGPLQQVGPSSKEYERRASPLLIHIHLCGKTPVAVLSFLPAEFLPAGVGVSVGGTNVPLDREPSLWAPVHALLDRFLGKPGATTRRESFGSAVEVRL